MAKASHDLAQARFYGILDTGYVSDKDWELKCQALITGGADIIQLRAKKQSSTERLALLERILPFFTEKAPPLIINDDLELALAYPGLGLHVGQDDLSVIEARAALGPERILGLSTHSVAQAQGAIGQVNLLDYFAVGPVFATPTKPTYTPVGLQLVATVAGWDDAGKVALPWFSIGGINRQTVSEVTKAGAKRIVVVSDVLCAEDTASAIQQIKAEMPEAGHPYPLTRD